MYSRSKIKKLVDNSKSTKKTKKIKLYLMSSNKIKSWKMDIISKKKIHRIEKKSNKKKIKKINR